LGALTTLKSVIGVVEPLIWLQEYLGFGVAKSLFVTKKMTTTPFTTSYNLNSTFAVDLFFWVGPSGG
jgi:hypothetical protein